LPRLPDRGMVRPTMKLPRIPKPSRHASAPARPAPTDADSALFRELIGPVRPLTHASEVPVMAERPPAEPRQFERDEAAVRDELLDHAFDPATIEVGEEIHHLKAGQPGRLLRQLRRGQFSVRAELDLHQMTAEVAREAIHAFLDEAIRHHEYCVRIVHGKGLRSATARGPVLKGLTEQILRRRSDVVAFSSALPAQGGTGAVLVLLGRP